MQTATLFALNLKSKTKECGKFNPDGKFKFPGENMNQSDYRNYGDYGSTKIIQHKLFF